HGLVSQSRQFAGLACSLHGATEDELKRVAGEDRAHPLREPATVVGQRDVGGPSVLSTQAPRRLAVPDREDVQHASPRILRRCLPQWNGRRRKKPLPAPTASL